MKTINTRLKDELMGKQGLTSYVIAKRLDAYVSTVDSWLVGVKKPGKAKAFYTPSAEMIVAICKEFNLDLVYILTGVKAEKTYKRINVTPKDESAKVKVLETTIQKLQKELVDCQVEVMGYKTKEKSP